MPTAPMWTGARLAAVGIAEGLGVSMTLLYARVRAATQLARYVRFKPPFWKSLLMSALGQKQTFRSVRTSEHVRVMSALPPKADIAPCNYEYTRSTLIASNL